MLGILFFILFSCIFGIVIYTLAYDDKNALCSNYNMSVSRTDNVVLGIIFIIIGTTFMIMTILSIWNYVSKKIKFSAQNYIIPIFLFSFMLIFFTVGGILVAIGNDETDTRPSTGDDTITAWCREKPRGEILYVILAVMMGIAVAGFLSFMSSLIAKTCVLNT